MYKKRGKIMTNVDLNITMKKLGCWDLITLDELTRLILINITQQLWSMRHFSVSQGETNMKYICAHYYIVVIVHLHFSTSM